MRIVDTLLVTGVATALFTIVQMPVFLKIDSGLAAGMFFAGFVLTVLQLGFWGYNR